MLDTAHAASLDEVVVVLGHAAQEIIAALELPAGARITINPEYEMGQSTSLRTGLRAADPASSAALLLLGDQPRIRLDAIETVVGCWRDGGRPVVQASYTGRPSHPVLFARMTWAELERAEGDEGARGALAMHPEWLDLAEVGGAPPSDLDTEEDYERLRAVFERGA